MVLCRTNLETLAAAEIEGDFREELLSGLEEKGHRLFRVSPKDVIIGSIHAVRLSNDGTIEGKAPGIDAAPYDPKR
ncbi:MAG: hypothetical protein ACE5KS_08930 [Woeseiaceae bacterium]